MAGSDRRNSPYIYSFNGFNAITHLRAHTHMHAHIHTQNVCDILYTHKTVRSRIRVMVCLYMVTVLKEGQVAVTAI